MRKIVIGLSLTATMLALSAYANPQTDNGKTIFESKGCALCHKSDVDTIGPSLRTIATAYTGKGTEIVSYLQGQGTPIVDPARASVMNPQLAKMKTLFDKDLKAVAEYIISANDRPN